MEAENAVALGGVRMTWWNVPEDTLMGLGVPPI